MNKSEITFSPLTVSTMTCVTSIAKQPSTATPSLINIFAIAKYLALDSTIVGIKLVYAAGQSPLLRGTCRPCKRKKDFYNQVTFNLHLNGTSLISYKLFYNGSVQLTGAHSPMEAAQGANYILQQLRNLKGLKVVELKSTENGVLVAHDFLVYSWNGRIIGYAHDTNGVYINNEYLELWQVQGHTVLLSKKWVNHCKHIYSLDGDHIGTRRLTFQRGISKSIYRKPFKIEDDLRVTYRGDPIGQETITFVPNYLTLLTKGVAMREKYVYPQQCVVHDYTVFREPDAIREHITADDIHVYNLNSRFETNFRIFRDKLHACFLKNGYVSRWNSETHLGVNLRYHYIPDQNLPMEKRGKCFCDQGNHNVMKRKCSNCKVVSLLCFVSGKLVLTGTKSLTEAMRVAEFIKNFYVEHYEEIREVV